MTPMTPFEPCCGCWRHIKADESRCPFCGVRVTRVVTRASAAVSRVTRAALFVGMTMLVPSCSETKTETPTPAPKRRTVDAAPGKSPAPDAGVTKTEPLDSTTEPGVDYSGKRPVPPYGAPPSPDDLIV